MKITKKITENFFWYKSSNNTPTTVWEFGMFAEASKIILSLIKKQIGAAEKSTKTKNGKNDL